MSSSRLSSFENAPSSISDIRLPVKSILFRVAAVERRKTCFNMERNRLKLLLLSLPCMSWSL